MNDLDPLGPTEGGAVSNESSGNAPGSESDQSDRVTSTINQKPTNVEHPPPKRRKIRQKRESQKHKRHASAHSEDNA